MHFQLRKLEDLGGDDSPQSDGGKGLSPLIVTAAADLLSKQQAARKQRTAEMAALTWVYEAAKAAQLLALTRAGLESVLARAQELANSGNELSEDNPLAKGEAQSKNAMSMARDELKAYPKDFLNEPEGVDERAEKGVEEGSGENRDEVDEKNELGEDQRGSDSDDSDSAEAGDGQLGSGATEANDSPAPSEESGEKDKVEEEGEGKKEGEEEGGGKKEGEEEGGGKKEGEEEGGGQKEDGKETKESEEDGGSKGKTGEEKSSSQAEDPNKAGQQPESDRLETGAIEQKSENLGRHKAEKRPKKEDEPNENQTESPVDSGSEKAREKIRALRLVAALKNKGVKGAAKEAIKTVEKQLSTRAFQGLADFGLGGAWVSFGLTLVVMVILWDFLWFASLLLGYKMTMNQIIIIAISNAILFMVFLVLVVLLFVLICSVSSVALSAANALSYIGLSPAGAETLTQICKSISVFQK